MENNHEHTNNTPSDQPQADLSTTPGITFVDSHAAQFAQEQTKSQIDEYLKKILQKAKDKKRFSAAFIPSIIYFILSILISISIQSILMVQNPDGITVMQELTMQSATMLFAHIITLLLATKLLKEKLFSPITAKPLKPKLAFLMVIFALGAGRLAEVGITPLYQLFPPTTDSSIYFSTPQTTILFFVTVAIIPAIFEEWLLRGIVLKHLLPFGKWTAIIVSSAIFGMMHSHPGQAIFAFVLGIMLGIIYINSGGNIWLCFIVHFLNNAISVIQGYFVANKIEGAAYNWLVFLTVYISLIVAIAMLFFYVFKSKKPFFLPEGETAEDSYDLKPKSAANLIFSNGSTYVYLFISIFFMIIAITYTP